MIMKRAIMMKKMTSKTVQYARFNALMAMGVLFSATAVKVSTYFVSAAESGTILKETFTCGPVWSALELGGLAVAQLLLHSLSHQRVGSPALTRPHLEWLGAV
jgi:hypothetical protein